MIDIQFSFFKTGPARTDVVYVRDSSGQGQTVRFGDPFVEDFEFGWSRETTFDSVCDDARMLLDLARSDQSQLYMRAAIIMLVSGLEAFVQMVLGGTRPQSQSLKHYNTALKNSFPGYSVPQGRQAMALDRLFKTRHAIVHNGARATEDIVCATGIARNSPLNFSCEEVEEVIQHAESFVNHIDEQWRNRSLGEV